VKSKQKRRNPNKKENPNINPGNPNNKKHIFYLDFTNLLFGFPEFSKESGKSKQKSSFFILLFSHILFGFPGFVENNNFYFLFGFPGFSFGFPICPYNQILFLPVSSETAR
jgi:hypothetical protein